MELAEFIEARLADDEEAAREASTAEWYLAQPAKCECCQQIRAQDGGGSLVCSADDRDAAHIVRHDPARVLREVEAKREILTRYGFAVRQADVNQANGNGAEAEAWEKIAGALELDTRSLAAIWSDHPDYDAAWALSPGTARPASR